MIGRLARRDDVLVPTKVPTAHLFSASDRSPSQYGILFTNAEKKDVQ